MARTKKQPTVASRVGDLVDERDRLLKRVTTLEEKLAKAVKQLEKLADLRVEINELRSENIRLHNSQATIESKLAGKSAKPKRTRKSPVKKGKGEPSEQDIVLYLAKRKEA